MRRCFAPRLALAAALAAAPACLPRPAPAQLATVCVNCSEQITQLLQYAKEVEQVAETITMRIAQAQMLKNQITNMASLPGSMWHQISGNFAATQGLFSRGTQLAANAGMVSSQLRSFTGLLSNMEEPIVRYDRWSRQANDNVTATLAGFGLQRDQMASDRAVIDNIRSRSAGAEGMKQAIQANTEMAGAQVNELHRLRELMIEDARMHANAMQMQAERQATGEAETVQFMNWTDLSETGNKRY